MVKLLESVKTHLLLDSRIAGVSKVTIGSRSAEDANCITLVYNGGADDTNFLGNLKPLEYPMFIAYIRNTSYAAGFDQAAYVVQQLFGYTDSSLGVDGVRKLGNIAAVGRDELDRFEFMVTYQAYVKE